MSSGFPPAHTKATVYGLDVLPNGYSVAVQDGSVERPSPTCSAAGDTLYASEWFGRTQSADPFPGLGNESVRGPAFL